VNQIQDQVVSAARPRTATGGRVIGVRRGSVIGVAIADAVEIHATARAVVDQAVTPFERTPA
jgi:hypothetical protein